MKKLTLLLLLSGVLLVLAACSDSDKQAASDEEETEQEENNGETEETSETGEGEVKDSTVDKEKQEEEKTESENTEPLYEINNDTWTVAPLNEEVNEKVVLLTIDDAPDTYAVEMAHTLKELDANAIFFVNGHFLDTPEEEEMLKEIHDLGFYIGNHTFSHVNLQEETEETQKEEIVSLNDRIEEIIGERPSFFRAPHGANTDYSIHVAEEEGMTVMNWTYGYDYFEPYMDAEKLTEAMITGEAPEIDIDYSLLKPGANLLMHDREWTNAALKDIVKGLREQGYEMVDPGLITTK